MEAAGEQEFVFDSVGGMKRLELEERVSYILKTAVD